MEEDADSAKSIIVTKLPGLPSSFNYVYWLWDKTPG
jgi:hypothetical protein